MDKYPTQTASIQKASAKAPKKRLANKGKKHKNNNQRLTTPIGKLLDSVSYKIVIGSIAAAIVCSASCFHYWSPSKQGDVIALLDWPSSLYLSIVTFTSLGYGDISPVGHGRTVAAAEVLFGLVSIAVLVGKMASERQAAILFLIYSSEQQRRITVFRKKVNKAYNRIQVSFLDYNHDALFEQVKRMVNFIPIINNHLLTHANEGKLTHSGNFPSLRKLYNELSQFQLVLYNILKTAHVEERTLNHVRSTLTLIKNISTSMRRFHKRDTVSLGLFNQLDSLDESIQKWYVLRNSGQRLPLRHRAEPTEFLLSRVYESLPLLPWEEEIHRDIARLLNIEYKLAARCINILIEREHWLGLKPYEAKKY